MLGSQRMNEVYVFRPVISDPLSRKLFSSPWLLNDNPCHTSPTAQAGRHPLVLLPVTYLTMVPVSSGIIG